MARKRKDPSRLCEIEHCDKPHFAIRYCSMHYTRLKRHNDLNYEYIRPTEPCDFGDCHNPREKRELCSAHYLERYGKKEIRSRLNVKHFYENEQYVEFIDTIKTQFCEVNSNDCWIWQRSNSGGMKSKALPYGTIVVAGKTVKIHRIMKSASLGGIDFSQEQIHHTCSETLCCNPDHLQQLTQQENIAEMKERTFYKNRIIDFEQQIALLQKELDQVRMV